MSDLIIVKAKIKILTAQEGGKRTAGIISGYRPNHVFERIDMKPFSAYAGDVVFNDSEYIYPGEERIVKVRFLKISRIEKYIHQGRKWWIFEVPNLIAEGEILELL